jgi:glycosyltransferase involved in cell wall biosynthesis
MELGVPIVGSDAPAVREVVGDAAIIVSSAGGVGGDEPAAWAAGVRAARSGRDALVAAGRDRRAAFTTAVSGDALRQAYRVAASGVRR